MSDARYEVVGVGHALVDVLSHETEDLVRRLGLPRGAATMADQHTVQRVYGALGPGREVSGGSAANTIAGIASFGGPSAFIGRVRSDEMGGVFAHDLRALGVHYDGPAALGGPPTGRCLVIVTPDAQRTMCTYLGAAAELGPSDIDIELIGTASVTYLEGYLWDEEDAKAALRHAATVAHEAGRLVAFTLSDPLCVDRHREEFRHFVEHQIDILFANEIEICSLYEVESFDDALQHVQHHVEVAALTRSEKGSVIVSGEELHVIDPFQLAEVVDSTGAGDQYAAGFLHAYTHGHHLATCGRYGSLAASEVITHLGPRPESPLAELAAKHLG